MTAIVVHRNDGGACSLQLTKSRKGEGGRNVHAFVLCHTMRQMSSAILACRCGTVAPIRESDLIVKQGNPTNVFIVK